MQTSNHDKNGRVDVLIVGQGLSGTFLSWELERAGLSHIVIDEERPDSASRAAAGLINPVTGRRIVTTWMIDELLPFGLDAYRQIGQTLGNSFISAAKIIDFFPTVQMRLAFLHRYAEDPQFLQVPDNEHAWDTFFRYEFGYGIIHPCYLVDANGLLEASRRRLMTLGILRSEPFVPNELIVEEGNTEGVRYGDIEAGRVIFCDGIESATSSYFSRLPFAPNKGEALLVDIPGLQEWTQRQAENGGESLAGIVPIFKKGISIVPWRDGLYWVGSSYEWSFKEKGITAEFRSRTEAILAEWLKGSFRTIRHIASVRPATLERRPFVGFHPLFPAVGILNGMGAKGCSLAPFFARQLSEYLNEGTAIRPDADVRRFNKILSKK